MQVACNFHIWLCFDFSSPLLIVTAIRMDRFLALRLGLIYRKAVTLKRSILAAIVIWEVSIYCQPTDTLAMEPSDNPMVLLHLMYDITVLSCHDFRLHHDLFHASPASKPATGLGQFAAKLRHSCTRPEHSEIQGSCLTFSLGASDVMRLLLAICSHWDMATLLR